MKACQHYKDIMSLAPDTIPDNVLWNYDPIIKMMVSAILEARWDAFRAENWFIHLTLETGTCGIGTYGNMVSQDVIDSVEGLKNKILTGEIVVEQKFEW